jgi:hypothetical protein
MTRPTGEQHRTRWTKDEVTFLMSEWSDAHDEDTLAVVADLLGRTVEACRQRWYETGWGAAVEPVTAKPEPGAIRFTRTTTTTTTVEWVGDVCPDCYCVRSVNGLCCCA